MRELQSEFIGKGQVKGFKFTQVQKTKYGYIYEVKSYNRTWYEVFKRVENSYYNVVSYPTNKAFGVWAWTVNSIQKANELLSEIELKAQINEG